MLINNGCDIIFVNLHLKCCMYMNKTAELVKLWADYEVNHPDAGIDEFCHFFLVNEREKENKINFSGSVMPPDLHSVMIKMIGRVVKLHNNYALTTLKECGLNSIDEFLYLNTIATNDSSKKTQVIYSNFNELSSGLLILDRLKNKLLISEVDDKEDKRSKIVSVTKKGSKTLKDCYKKLSAINEFFFRDMPDDDIRLCIQLLSPTEVKFSAKWVEDKGKSLDELNK